MCREHFGGWIFLGGLKFVMPHWQTFLINVIKIYIKYELKGGLNYLHSQGGWMFLLAQRRVVIFLGH